MSKWSDEFVEQFKDTGTVKRLKKEIDDAVNKKRSQKNINNLISEIMKGKYKRKGGKK